MSARRARRLELKCSRCAGATLGWAALLAVPLAACDGFAPDEAVLAADEVTFALDSEALALATIELASDVTVGATAEANAAAIATSIEAATPCAAIEVASELVEIEYGALPGVCTFGGRALSGQHTFVVVESGATEVEVFHSWSGLSDGNVSVVGAATVHHRLGEAARTVHHSLEWTRLADGATASGTASLAVEPALLGGAPGFTLEGEREWHDGHGEWRFTVAESAMRFADPCPESGGGMLDAPFRERVSLTFERASSSVVSLLVTNGSQSYHFEVSTDPSGGT